MTGWVNKPPLGVLPDLGHPLMPDAGLWLFNENAGGIYDLSGKGNDGTWAGTGTRWGPGKDGPAGIFNGADDYIRVGSGTGDGLDPASKTIIVTIRAGAVSAAQYIIDRLFAAAAGNRRGYAIYQASNDRIYFQITDNAGNSQSAISNDAVAVGNLYHVVGVHDAAATSNNVRIYINGIEQTTKDSATGYTPYNNFTTIGATRTGGTNFNGHIANIGIFSRALSSAEIQEDYQNLYGFMQYPSIARLYVAVVGLSIPVVMHHRQQQKVA